MVKNRVKRPTLSLNANIYQMTAQWDYKRGKSIAMIAEEMQVTIKEVTEWVKS